MNISENISLAIRAIRANKQRTILTICIIALGLMALLAILTSIEALKSSINKNFATLGANSFTIRNEGQLDGGDGNEEPAPEITRREAESFKEKFDYPAIVSISYMPFGATTLNTALKKTNPNVQVMAADDNYVFVAGYEMEKGRWFISGEIESASRTIILGSDVVEKLFDKNTDPIGKGVSVQSQSFKIIGVLKSKGNSMMANDNICFIPTTSARSVFPANEGSYVISVAVNNIDDMEPAIGNATGVMRQVRKLDVRKENNFSIMKSDSIISLVMNNISYVTIGAVIIGLITLFGAAIGLMNIMLVQVNERTREIGISMAIGAKGIIIRRQFLTESIVICLLGGIIGIILGIIAGNFVAQLFDVSFFIPWGWVLGGIVLCFITGIAAGYYPAVKASKLDPIEALRYE